MTVAHSHFRQFAKLLIDRGAIVAIAVLRKSALPIVRDGAQLAAQNLMGNSSDSKRESRQRVILESFESLEAFVNWDTWNSKLDNIFAPVFAAAPQAIGRHVVTLVDATRKIVLKGEDSQGKQLSYKIIQAPSHGKLSHIRSDAGVVYTPDEGYTGDDYFTYVARNSYMESNVATVAIKIRNNTELQQAAKAVEALLNEKSIGDAVMPALNLMGEAFLKQLVVAKKTVGGWGGGGAEEGGGDVELGGGGSWLGSWGWGGGGGSGGEGKRVEIDDGGAKMPLFHELEQDESVPTTGSKKMAQTRAQIRTHNLNSSKEDS